jgi:DUF4097 and DUF4098 domain-containing protein YvlB
MRVRALTLALGAVVLATSGSATASPTPTLHEASASRALPGVIRSVVVDGDQGSISLVAGKVAGLRAHEKWNVTRPTFTASLSGGVLRITTDCKENTQVANGVYLQGFNDCAEDLILTVPASVNLNVTSGWGDISSVGISGALLLHSDDGAVSVSRVARGSIDASSGYGSVRATAVTARTVALRSTNGVLAATGVRATSLAEHSGYGTVTADDVRASRVDLSTDNGGIDVRTVTADAVAVSSGYGSVTLNAIKAPLVTAHGTNGAVTLGNVLARSASATSGYGPVSLSDVTGAVVIAHSDNGTVEVALPVAPTRAAISSGYGKVALTVPAGRYALSASTGYGVLTISGIAIDSRAPRVLGVHSDNGSVSVTGA